MYKFDYDSCRCCWRYAFFPFFRFDHLTGKQHNVLSCFVNYFFGYCHKIEKVERHECVDRLISVFVATRRACIFFFLILFILTSISAPAIEKFRNGGLRFLMNSKNFPVFSFTQVTYTGGNRGMKRHVFSCKFSNYFNFARAIFNLAKHKLEITGFFHCALSVSRKLLEWE